MAKYKLVAGQHIQNDPDGKPHTYNPGDIVESDTDLINKLGAERFILVSGEEGDRFPSQNAAPQGQVSEGFQVTSGREKEAGPAAPIRAETARDAARLAAGQPEAEREARDRTQGIAQEIEKKEGNQPTGEGQQATSQQATHQPTHQPGQRQPTQGSSSQEKGRSPTEQKEYHAQLDRMTIQQLKAHAEEEEIDLKGAKTRDEMLKALKSAK